MRWCSDRLKKRLEKIALVEQSIKDIQAGAGRRPRGAILSWLACPEERALRR